ncbi:MAG: helix-turn-helix domain-containing protein [Candidatus Omnitrophota bacterium]
MKKRMQEQREAVWLRSKGMSYLQIARKIGVSTGSLSRWLHDISVQNKKFSIAKASDAFINRGRILRAEKILRAKTIKTSAVKEIGKVTERDLLIGGAILYWAEGTKVGEEVCISNSDPQVIKFAMRWFRDICHVAEEKFRVQMYIHTDLDHDKCLHFWMKIMDLPKEQFNKPYIKKSTLGHRKNVLYNGTINIRVNDKNLHRKIMGWIDALALC